MNFQVGACYGTPFCFSGKSLDKGLFADDGHFRCGHVETHEAMIGVEGKEDFDVEVVTRKAFVCFAA